ncbi:lipopolysaccharide transport periplasmic protein LptA [Ahniella affigens]|nr:lipopolysaccharide transport periplasmic protein LptA [Ahniella affigens]
MSLKSDTSNGNLEEGRVTLAGNVEITQGSLIIRANSGEILQVDGRFDRANFDGTPVTIEQDIDGQGKLHAEAKRVEYQVEKEVITLIGGVKIDRPRGSMRGERIVYNLATGDMDAGNSGSRVELIIQPKPKTKTN